MARSARGDDISGGILGGGKDCMVSAHRYSCFCQLCVSDLQGECRVGSKNDAVLSSLSSRQDSDEP